jgi:hypothetical protein
VALAEANTSNGRQSSVCRNSINIWWAVDIEPAGPHKARHDEAPLKNRHQLEEFTARVLAMTSIAI